jgi:hypothetical protein
MRDADGNLLYFERPIDPNMTMLEFLRPVLFREPPPPPQTIDPEKLELQIREKIRQEIGETKSRGEEVDVEKIIMKVREDMRSQFQPALDSLQKELEAQRREVEIQEAVKAAVKPLIERIDELQSRQGLEKDERAQERLQAFVREAFDNMKGEFKETIALGTLPYYASLEQEKGLPEGTLTGPILERLKGTVRDFKAPTPFERSKLLHTMRGWAGE